MSQLSPLSSKILKNSPCPAKPDPRTKNKEWTWVLDRCAFQMIMMKTDKDKNIKYKNSYKSYYIEKWFCLQFVWLLDQKWELLRIPLHSNGIMWPNIERYNRNEKYIDSSDNRLYDKNWNNEDDIQYIGAPITLIFFTPYNCIAYVLCSISAFLV